MADFLHMGGYGAYVWSAYAVFVVVLVTDALTPLWQKRATLRDIAARLRRESAKAVPSETLPRERGTSSQ
jgi:heme exporter protein D